MKIISGVKHSQYEKLAMKNIYKRKIHWMRNSQEGNSEGKNARKAKIDERKVCDEKKLRGEINAAEKFTG